MLAFSWAIDDGKRPIMDPRFLCVEGMLNNILKLSHGGGGTAYEILISTKCVLSVGELYGIEIISKYSSSQFL